MVEQTLNERFKPVLLAFMVHMNVQECDAEYNFIREELIAITLDTVARYMRFKAYVMEEPTLDARSNGC